MPKLSTAIIAIAMLCVITSCKKSVVKPNKVTPTDTTQTETKEWTQLNDYPGDALRWTYGFSAANKGYVIGGEYENTSTNDTAKVFQYDASADKWKRLSD